MFSGRSAGAVLALVLLAAVAPANALSAPPGTVRLGGTVTLTGSTSFSRSVVIDKPVRIRLGDWKVTAPRGRFAGFVLRQDGPEDVMPTVMDIQPGMCHTRACERAWWSVPAGCLCAVEIPDPADSARGILRPGRYRLYLIADGAPVTVHLPLPGLRGRTTLSAGAGVAARIDALRPAQLEPPIPSGGVGGNLYSAGGSRTVGSGGGMQVLVMWKYLVGAPKAANNGGVCFYPRTPKPAAGAPYQAPCDGGSWQRLTTGQDEIGAKGGPNGTFDLYATSLKRFGLLERGPIGVGGHINSANPATAAYAQNLWLDFTR